MPFLQSFASQQLLILFSKNLDTMSIRQIVSPVKQIFDKLSFEICKVVTLPDKRLYNNYFNIFFNLKNVKRIEIHLFFTKITSRIV